MSTHHTAVFGNKYDIKKFTLSISWLLPTLLKAAYFPTNKTSKILQVNPAYFPTNVSVKVRPPAIFVVPIIKSYAIPSCNIQITMDIRN